jgi:hypothetical protein
MVNEFRVEVLLGRVKGRRRMAVETYYVECTERIIEREKGTMSPYVALSDTITASQRQRNISNFDSFEIASVERISDLCHIPAYSNIISTIRHLLI